MVQKGQEQNINTKNQDVTQQKKQDDIKTFIDLVSLLIPPFKEYLAHSDKKSRDINHAFYAMLVFLIIIVAFVSLLTYIGKVSGDALLFLIGTAVGYILSFMLELAKKTWFSS